MQEYHAQSKHIREQMQYTVVGEGCDLEYVITDKNVTISADKEIKGTNTFPVYAAKFQKI